MTQIEGFLHEHTVMELGPGVLLIWRASGEEGEKWKFRFKKRHVYMFLGFVLFFFGGLHQKLEQSDRPFKAKALWQLQYVLLLA